MPPRHICLKLALLVFVSACNSAPQAPPPEPGPSPQPAQLEIAPTQRELVFSADEGRDADVQTVSLTNSGALPLELTRLELTGPEAESFALEEVPALPLTVAPGTRTDLRVGFKPASLGVHTANLDITSSDADLPEMSFGLYGLAATGKAGEDEPSLAEIAETLGYVVDVGGDDLSLGNSSNAIGQEELVPMFERASAGPVTLELVARYGDDKTFPYGIFRLDEADPVREELGEVSAETSQTLFPTVEGERGSFDPGSAAFGIYSGDSDGARYSLDPLNRGTLRHPVRSYPLRDRSGRAVTNSYLIGLEADAGTAYQDAVFVLRNVKPSTAELPDERDLEGWQSIFNGKNLSGWYTYLPGHGRGSDPEDVFKVEDGVMHFLDVPDRGYRDFGYLATQKSYSNYHLRLQYKWGDKRFDPRKYDKRDSGIIYHFGGPDQTWPTGVEFQIQEGDTGDFWMIEGTTLRTTVENPNATPPQYDADGKSYTSRAGDHVQVMKDKTHDWKSGWNTVEVIVRGSSAVHIVNGRVNNRAQKLYKRGGGTLSSGKILLQAEGAEIYFRNIEIRQLSD